MTSKNQQCPLKEAHMMCIQYPGLIQSQCFFSCNLWHGFEITKVIQGNSYHGYQGAVNSNLESHGRAFFNSTYFCSVRTTPGERGFWVEN